MTFLEMFIQNEKFCLFIEKYVHTTRERDRYGNEPSDIFQPARPVLTTRERDRYRDEPSDIFQPARPVHLAIHHVHIVRVF